ncbi:MAG: hypothetical protein QOF62_1949 [Pyrinomonadaceae bacterium]|jgi:hypothetical protein|nr:hypothetical protein [Pyrinomonadaceae bacterium]
MTTRAGLITSVTLLLFVALVAASALAQTNDSVAAACDAKVKAPDYSLPEWPEKAEVKVFIVAADFNPEQIAAILTPLRNWSAVAEATGSQVTFVYSGPTAEHQDCLNCLTIMRGKVHDNQKHAAELQATVNQGEQTILYARLVIDRVIPNLTALTNAVAHELGHNFGLRDCFECRAGTTVMGLIRSSDGLTGPTRCDVAQVRRVYDHVRIYSAEVKRRKPQQVAKIVPVDEGEEPVDDDTPIVVKKP